MQINKIKKIGTKINYYINKFYDAPKDVVKFTDYSETKFNNTIEILLCFGIIKPQNINYFEVKAQFKDDAYRFTGIKKDEIAEEFIKVLKSDLTYKEQDDTLYNICLSNLAYDFESEKFDEEKIEQISVLLKSTFEKEAAKYWIVPELNSIIARVAMEEYVGLSEKFKISKMNPDYFSFAEKFNIQKIHAEKKVSGINAKEYNINMLINHLNNYKYNIPIYQRNYVWDTDSIDRLFYDIETNEYVNLNNVTFYKNSLGATQSFNIIDGQQRLTTLFLILIALHRYLNSYFRDYDDKWANQNVELLSMNMYIYKNLFEDEKIKTNFGRIEGNTDYMAFQNLMNGKECSLEMINTKIYKNYEHSYKLISEMDPTKLISFSKKFLYNVVFILTIDEVSDEFILFEKLNTTSIPLSTIDLIKSYMLSLINEEMDDKEVRFQEAFERKITKPLEDVKDIDTFIRVYIRTKTYSLDKNLTLLEQYKKINNIKRASLSFNEVNKLLDDLSMSLELYKYVTGKEYERIEQIRNLKIGDFVETLGERDIYVPIMLHLIEKYMKKELDSNEIRELLFELEKFEVIFKICSYRGQSLTSVMDNILRKLVLSNEYSVKKFKQILSEEAVIRNTLSISPEAFKSKFNEFEFKTQISKIVLVRITNYLKNNKKIRLNSSDEVRRIKGQSLEHIMPMKGEKWIKAKIVNEKEHQMYVNKIGNHLILEKSLNSKVKNSLFEEKMKEIREQTHMDDDYTYTIGANNIGFEIKSLKSFDRKTINDRQKFLTDLAVEIWKG